MKENIENNIKNISLPFSDKELEKYFGNFDKFLFRINYKESLKNLESNSIIYTYLENCNIQNSLIYNYELDKNFEDFVLEYVKRDSEIIIPLLSELWIEMLLKDNSDYKPLENNDYNNFVSSFINHNGKILNSIKDLFYSINIFMEYLIVKENKNIENKIKSADKRSIKNDGLGVNVVSLRDSLRFYNFMALNNRDNIYNYEEFNIPCLNGYSILYPFSNGNTPYAMMIIYNEYYRNPEKIKKIFEKIKANSRND